MTFITIFNWKNSLDLEDFFKGYLFEVNGSKIIIRYGTLYNIKGKAFNFVIL